MKNNSQLIAMYQILYVDDDPNLLDIGRFFLEDLGNFSVATSTLATEALNLPDLDSFDAIISDYEMPLMDGITFLKNVRAVHGDIPFILFTGKGREEVVIEAINNGADFYLQKGGDPEAQFAELAHKIKKAVERKRADSALQESERRYRNLYRYALVGLFETSLKDATIVACNQQYCDLSGFASVEEAIGKDVLSLYENPDDRREVIRILHEQGYLEGHEVRFRNRLTGQSFWARFSARINREKDVAEGTIIDITDRKRLEADLGKKHEELKVSYEELNDTKKELHRQFEQLAESERILRVNDERLVMAQRIGQTGSWEYDLETNKIWGSSEALHIFGYPPVARDFPINDIEACIPERDRIHQALVDMITKGYEYNLEYVINPADGSAPKIIHSVARLEKDAEGNPLRAVGVIQDISDRKRVEEQITFKNIILSTQEETSLDGILIVDENGKILNYNQKFIEIWGIPDSIIASRVDEPVLQYVVGQQADPDTFLSRVNYLYEHTDERSFEELVLEDGRTIERFSAPMLGENGKYYGRVWYFRDITGRKQVDFALRESENRYRSLFDTMHDCVAVYRVVADGEDFVLLEFNRAAEKTEQVTRDEVIGCRVTEVFPMVKEFGLLDVFRRVWRTGMPESYPITLYKDKRISGWRENFVYKLPSGEIVANYRDETACKQAEAGLRESEQRFRQVFDTLPIGMWIADQDGTLVMGNPSGQKIWEAHPQVKMEEYGIFKAWRLPNREPVRSDDWALGYAVNEGRITNKELLEIEAFDGSHKYILNWAAPLKNNDGEITGAFVLNQDITDSVQSERALKESEQRYRTYIDNSPSGIFILDASGHCQDVNPTACSMLGYSREELLELSIMDLAPVDGRSNVLSGFSELLKTGSLTAELPILKKNGDVVPVIVNAVLLPDEQYMAFCTDISERKQAEEEIWTGQKILEGILNSIQVRVFWKDRNLMYLGCNTPFARDAGFEKPADIIGKDDFAMGWRDQADLYRSDDRSVIASGMPKMFIEEPQKTPSGDIISLLTSKVPLYDAKGIIIGVLGTYIDITERKRYEDALKKSEENNRLTLDATNDGVWDWNIPSDTVFFSPRWYTRLGYEPYEMPGSFAMWQSLIHPDDVGLSEQKIKNHIGKKDEFYSLEFRMRTKQGDWKWIMSRGKVVERDAEGSPVRMVGTHTDISERKRSEEALAEVNKKLNLLNSITRHDINNKLLTLNGFIGMLQRKITDPSVQDDFSNITRVSRQISAMIQFTKEYESIGVMAPVWQSPASLVNRAAKQTQLGTIQVKNDITYDVEVFADPLIFKVFYNLMDNAVRYGGKISTIRFSLLEHDGDPIIVCEDDGDGIASDEKEQIFDRGFGKNTGYGLFLAREILSITGIRIRETGEPGKGARFEIVVPKCDYRRNPDIK